MNLLPANARGFESEHEMLLNRKLFLKGLSPIRMFLVELQMTSR